MEPIQRFLWLCDSVWSNLLALLSFPLNAVTAQHHLENAVHIHYLRRKFALMLAALFKLYCTIFQKRNDFSLLPLMYVPEIQIKSLLEYSYITFSIKCR